MENVQIIKEKSSVNESSLSLSKENTKISDKTLASSNIFSSQRPRTSFTPTTQLTILVFVYVHSYLLRLLNFW